MAMAHDKSDPSSSATGCASSLSNENGKPESSSVLASVSACMADKTPSEGRGEQTSAQSDLQARQAAFRARVSLQEKRRMQRIKSTSESEARSKELRDHNIGVRDFQEDADRQKIEAHAGWELDEMWDKQREESERYREALLKKEQRKEEREREALEEDPLNNEEDS